MASRDMCSVLTEFRSAAARLNAESDSANATIAQVQDVLVEANAGLELWLGRALLASDSDGSTGGESATIVQRLGFAKVAGDWCLAVKPVRIVTGLFEGDSSCPYQNEFGAGDPVPLLESSRQLRIAALEVLPELIELLTEQARAYSLVIVEAKQLRAAI